jgi:hypothetical protein
LIITDDDEIRKGIDGVFPLALGLADLIEKVPIPKGIFPFWVMVPNRSVTSVKFLTMMGFFPFAALPGMLSARWISSISS